MRHDEIERARIVKIDVEGAEGVVLAGLLPVPHTDSRRSTTTTTTPAALPAVVGGRRKSGLPQKRVFLTRSLDSGFHPYRVMNSYMPQDYPATLRKTGTPNPVQRTSHTANDLMLVPGRRRNACDDAIGRFRTAQ